MKKAPALFALASIVAVSIGWLAAELVISRTPAPQPVRFRVTYPHPRELPTPPPTPRVFWV